MPRPAKITELAVESAVAELKSTHTPVNPYQVRKILGEGSIAKIGYFLKALGHTTDYSAEKDDPLTLKLVNMLRPVALELDEQSKERIRQATQQLNTELEEKATLVSSLERQLGDKQSVIDEFEAKLEKAIAERDLSRDKSQKLEVELARLEEKVIQQAEQLEAAKSVIQQKESETAEARNEMRIIIKDNNIARQAMQENHEAEIKIYKEELDKRSEDYSALSAELEAARSSNEALQEKLRQQGIEKEVANSEVKSLKSDVVNREQQIASLREQVKKVEQRLSKERDSHQLEKREWQQKLSAIKARNVSLSGDNSRLENERAFLRSLIQKFQISSDQAEDTSEDRRP